MAVHKTSRAGAQAATSGDVAGVCRADERLQRMVRANGRDVRRLQRSDAPAVREHMSQVLASQAELEQRAEGLTASTAGVC